MNRHEIYKGQTIHIVADKFPTPAIGGMTYTTSHRVFINNVDESDEVLELRSTDDLSYEDFLIERAKALIDKRLFR